MCPSDFWDRAPVRIQKAVQRTIFPHGLVYDFETGFGTIELNESYLLIQKLVPGSANDSIVVGAAWMKWNLIKAEVIKSWQIVKDYNTANS